MERPNEIWWCPTNDEHCHLWLLTMKPTDCNSYHDGQCKIQCDKCDAVKGKIEWEGKTETESTDIMLKLNGKPVRCEECGCNVFRKSKSNSNVYVCNGCRARYIGEK